MSRFLYFLPVENDAVGSIDRLGLSYAFEESPTTRGCRRGPTGQAGTILSTHPLQGGPVGFFPDKQIWQPVAGVFEGGRPAVGMYTDNVPKPTGLMRREMLRGHDIQLGNGNLWTIPIARGFAEENGDVGWYTTLPQYRGLDENGKWVQKGVAERYQQLWDVATRFSATMLLGIEEAQDQRETVAEFDFDEENEAAVLALTTNYRISATEIDMLRLLNDTTVTELLLALIDWPTFMDLLKKKERADGSNIGDGVSEGEQITGPLSLN